MELWSTFTTRILCPFSSARSFHFRELFEKSAAVNIQTGMFSEIRKETPVVLDRRLKCNTVGRPYIRDRRSGKQKSEPQRIGNDLYHVWVQHILQIGDGL